MLHLPPLNPRTPMVYHSALIFITGDDYGTHHNVLYDKVTWSSLEAGRNKHVLFIYQAIVGKPPPYISMAMDWNSESYQTHSNDWHMLKVPYVHSELEKSAFCFDGPTSWNDLQHTLKINVLLNSNLCSKPSLPSFETVLTVFFVSQHH